MINAAQLVGAWTHSHEEDREGLEMWRAADYPLPPARGRTSFTLFPGHRAAVGTPGADDRGTTNDGTWSLTQRPDGDVLTVALPQWQATYLIVAADRERLELRPSLPS